MTLSKHLYLIATIFLASYILQSQDHIDTRTRAYYTDYLMRVKRHCSRSQYWRGNVTLEIVPIEDKQHVDGEQIGQCYRGISTANVQIDQDYWNEATPEQRQGTVDHELTHCLLFGKHSDDKNNYMYNHLRENMTRDELTSQVEEYIIAKCK